MVENESPWSDTEALRFGKVVAAAANVATSEEVGAVPLVHEVPALKSVPVLDHVINAAWVTGAANNKAATEVAKMFCFRFLKQERLEIALGSNAIIELDVQRE